MGYKYIEAIPLSNISKIELYMNTGKRSLAAIKKLKGCQYIMNGTIYSDKFTPFCNVKSNGVIQNDPKYSEYGYAWNTNDITMTVIPKTSYRNYIGCVPMIRDGKAQKMNYRSDMGNCRGRTAIGIKGNNLILYCSKDGSSYAKFPEELRSELLAYGCSSALMLDGGGSSQCDFNGKTVTSSRIVQNLVLIYLKTSSSGNTNSGSNTSSGTTNTSSVYMGTSAARSYIKAFQTWLNKNYKTGIVQDGAFGPKTKRAAIIALQKYLINERKCALTITGVFDSATKNAICKAIPVIKSGDKGNLVKIAQGILYCRGVNAKGFDGSFGPGMRAGVSWYQTHSNLTDTGTVNLNTWSNLLK